LGQSARSVNEEGTESARPERQLQKAIELTPDLLLRASEVNGLDATNLLLGRTGRSAGSNGGGPEGTHCRHEGASLHGGRRQLAAQWATESLGKGSRGHCDGMWSGDGSGNGWFEAELGNRRFYASPSVTALAGDQV
jgi:hypothetical protein